MGMLNIDFDENKLTPEQKETMKTIELELISVLKSKNPSDLIRFWEPHERKPDAEIEKIYPRIYSVELCTEYNKKFRRNLFKRTILSKNWKYMENPLINATYLELPFENQKKLIVWSKDSYKFLEKTIKERLGYSLKTIRFDFLLEEDDTFTIPYLPLFNIGLTRNPNDKQLVSFYVYLEEITKVFELVKQMHSGSSKNNSPS